MEIKYLQALRDYPSAYPDKSYKKTIEPISLSEIATLEQLYNNGNPFPAALKELLYLAGDYCYVLDYGMADSQQEMQEEVRERWAEERQEMTRPFMVIDVYNVNDQFLFIYLDEGDNPPVYSALYDDRIREIQPSLSVFLEKKINRVKEGINPF